MKKLLTSVSALMILSFLLCGCTESVCERCGESSMSSNLVGDDADGIHVCDTCIEKMRMGKINFNFTCDNCHEEKLGKKNSVTVDGEEKIYCNTCYSNGQ